MARVMLMEAETYLLDEPSASLDQNTEQFMIQNIVNFSKEKGRQLIMVSHSPQMKKMFPQGIWWLTMLMITIMLAFAIFNAIKRIGLVANKKLKQLMGISMIIGYICSATFFLLVVLKVMPWFNPKYCIPISGMIIGNAMTGIVLGRIHFVQKCKQNVQRLKIRLCWRFLVVQPSR